MDVAYPYIDDIKIVTWGEPGEKLITKHLSDVKRVMEVLKENRLIADIGKFRFFVTEVDFFRHILGGGTHRPAPDKLMAVEKWEVPRRCQPCAHS